MVTSPFGRARGPLPPEKAGFPRTSLRAVRSTESPAARLSGCTRGRVESDALVRIDRRLPPGISGIAPLHVSSRSGQCTNGARECAVLLPSRSPRRNPGRFQLLGDMLAPTEVHLVGRLTLECRVRKSRVMFSNVERHEPSDGCDCIERVQVEPVGSKYWNALYHAALRGRPGGLGTSLIAPPPLRY